MAPPGITFYNCLMTRRFLVVTLCLAVTIGVLIGLVVAGSMTPAPANATEPRLARAREANAPSAQPALTSFADVAERRA